MFSGRGVTWLIGQRSPRRLVQAHCLCLSHVQEASCADPPPHALSSCRPLTLSHLTAPEGPPTVYALGSPLLSHVSLQAELSAAPHCAPGPGGRLPSPSSSAQPSPNCPRPTPRTCLSSPRVCHDPGLDSPQPPSLESSHSLFSPHWTVNSEAQAEASFYYNPHSIPTHLSQSPGLKYQQSRTLSSSSRHS